MAGAASVLTEKFPERYPHSGAPKLYRAPGRVNLIGEHTDYNEGFVLPIALEMACYTAVAPGSASGQLRIYSEDLLAGAEWPAADIRLAKPRRHWTDYVFGVAQQLTARGIEISPKDLLIRSTVPVGAGLSSSAALEISSALALSDGRALSDKMELVRLGRAAENQFVGMPCGIMDQFISVFGRDHCAIKIDCRNLEYEEVPIPDDVVILAVNTMVKHELGASAYRERVAECGQAVAHIQRRHPSVNSLRDATKEMLGEGVEYLIPNLRVHVEYHEGKPISVELPPSVEMKVVEAEPGIKGGSVSNVGKPAKLETGLVVSVPQFVNEGDVIRVSTSDGSYQERVNS